MNSALNERNQSSNITSTKMSIVVRNNFRRGIGPQVDRHNHQSASTGTMMTVHSENGILHTITTSMIAIRSLTNDVLHNRNKASTTEIS